MKEGVDDSPSLLRRSTDWIAFAFLMIISGANLFSMVFLVPKFREIFNDMLGNRPLPSSTSFVLQGRYLFGMLALAYIGGGILVVRVAPSRIAYRYVLAPILVSLIQVGFTTCALFLPMVDEGDPIQGTNRP
jgi:type II secretory pathway component PulF